MRKIFLSVLVWLCATAFPGISAAQETKVAALTVSGAFVAPTRPGQPNGAAFLQIVNTGKTADRLVGFSVGKDIAERAELHTMKHENGTMMMREVSGFDLPPGGKLLLAPGGDHLMLIGIKQPLETGKEIAATLRFEKAGETKVLLKVRMPESHSMHRHGH